GHAAHEFMGTLLYTPPVATAFYASSSTSIALKRRLTGPALHARIDLGASGVRSLRRKMEANSRAHGRAVCFQLASCHANVGTNRGHSGSGPRSGLPPHGFGHTERCDARLLRISASPARPIR